jgi:two-component system alkaline phosphatase synthesis response regulator PhoP
MARQILVCDDEAHIQYAITFKLTAAGYEVIKAGDGREAIELLKSHRPDLIIMDYQMPYVNGLELCRHVRGQPDIRSTPMIMLTAKAMELSEEKVKAQFGIEAIFMKPFSPRTLLGAVEEVLSRPAAAAVS